MAELIGQGPPPDETHVLSTTQDFIKFIVTVHDMGVRGVKIARVGARKSMRRGAIVANFWLEKEEVPDVPDEDAEPTDPVGGGGNGNGQSGKKG